jgi:general secretion pathway protein E
VLAQRLVRKLCQECKRPAVDGPGFEAVGCPACNHTGYSGRTGVFELLSASDAIRAAVHERASEAELRRLATAAGMQTMRDDGMPWVLTGETSMAELMRVTRE